ncbi:MAG: GlsB/YeaQ/YmgE family stress response membrane protein [Allosphingosinicella sp.]|uniref:GlsB/YeaQ/YmgE family stress response membrane protein n=1 Tax=Allosphingosinicella sp. TaxID=2823234 RepID=UPI003963515F
MELMADYNWLWWIIIGGIAGAIAKLIMPGKDPGGIIVTILLGIAGALLAGFLGHAIGWYDQGEGAGFIAAIVGALIILALYRMIAGRRRPRI